MSGTVMKFGPQWIRTLTDGAASSSSVTNSSSTGSASSSNSNNNNINSASQSSANHSATSYISSSSTTSSSFNNNNNNNNSSSNGGAGKYKLAEYRYGREEMLALFEPDLDPPEDIKKFTDLYFDKARMPMAMTQMSDDEVKLSTRNWNSEAVLRSSSKVATTSGISGGPGGTSIPGGGIPGGPLGAAAGIVGSTLQDRDSRQLSDRGASGTMTAAGVLSSSPRGPPGSLSRMPLEQRGGLMSSLNSRGPTAIRNLVSRGPNLYNRSQSHDDETADEVGTTSGGGFESARFGLPGQSRQPSSLRSRFEVNRTLSSTTSGLKSTEAKGGQLVDGDLSNEQRRSVYDRLLKYNLDDKMVRKDVNGRPIQSGDWRSREWSGSGPDNRSSKAVTGDDRSWRTSRAGATEDWRSNNASNVTSTSSWYVRSDDQRNPRAAAAAASQSNLDPTGTGFNGKRDTLRRPSVDERQGDEEDEIQHRHRRDSLPEWSICDPLSGDKVGSFDATGAFREATIEDGSNVLSKEGKQDRSVFELKKQGAASGNAEQDWRPKQKNDTANTFNGIDQTANLNELEKLTLIEHNAIPVRNNETENVHNASNESRTKVSDNRRDLKQSSDRFGDFHNHQMNANKVDLQQRTSSPSNNDNEQKKSIDQTMNSSPPLRSSMNQALPETLQQMLKKANHNQQQSFISAISGSSNAVLPSNDEDGFAHLERAAEIMVAQWSAEEEHESSGSARFFGNKQANLIREQQNAQNNMIQSKNTDARLPNQAQQDQPTSQQQQQQHLQQLQQQQSHQQSGSEQNQANPSAMFDPNNQKKFILLPFTHEDSQQWFYRDTQGVIQGPFSATEMFEWYKAGYFVKELLVRRACDELFYPLGEVIKLWDRIPFAPLPLNHAPPPPITTQAFMQMRAIKQLELAGMNPAAQAQIPPNAFGLTHPGTVLLPGPLLAQQQQQVHPVLAAASMNRNLTGPQQDQRAAAGIRQMFDASRANEQVGVQQRAAHPGIVLDQNEMQAQLRQLLAQLKSREGFSNLNAQEQQEALVRQFVATQSGRILDPEQREMLMRARMMPFSAPFFANEQERFRYQQRLELEMQQKEEAEKQNRLIMEQRMKAEEENQRLMDELQKRQRKQKEAESEKHRQEAEKERILKLSQLKQQQLAKQQEEFRQMQQQQRLQQQQQEKQQQQQQKPQQAIQSNAAAAQQQQIERAKKAAQAQQVQQEQQRKTAWLTVSKPDQEPVSLATLQKMQEEEKEKERERQRQIQQQIQSNQQHQHQQLQQQLQRQMTWANAAQQPKPAPIKTLAEIQREEEERLAKEKQKKVKAQPVVPNAGVWNNAASHLNWKPPADS